jgi:putative ribosome biogenesis GTPase RsgA
MSDLGLSKNMKAQAALYMDLHLGRIISQSRDLYRVITEKSEGTAEISGKFRFFVQTPSDYPAVGDFVMLDRTLHAEGNAIIHHLLPRKSVFIRRASGTAHREQVVAANIDTPGMRELGIESADLAKTFGDVEELAGMCRFRDCTHTREPFCAVRQAIEEGVLSEERLESYRKLQKEVRYEGLNFRQIESEKIASMFAEVGGSGMLASLPKRKIAVGEGNGDGGIPRSLWPWGIRERRCGIVV